jgi:hypothetical protein
MGDVVFNVPLRHRFHLPHLAGHHVVGARILGESGGPRRPPCNSVVGNRIISVVVPRLTASCHHNEEMGIRRSY